MWLGKGLQLLCILPIGMLCVSTISMMLFKKIVGSVYVGLSESGLCVFRELCPVGFLIIIIILILSPISNVYKDTSLVDL